MPTPEERIGGLGFALPKQSGLPPGLHLPFSFLDVPGNRAPISDHPRQSADRAIEVLLKGP